MQSITTILIIHVMAYCSLSIHIPIPTVMFITYVCTVIILIQGYNVFPVVNPHDCVLYILLSDSLLSSFHTHTSQRRSTSKPDPTSNWQPPKLFKTRNYFSSSGSASSPGHTTVAGGHVRDAEEQQSS